MIKTAVKNNNFLKSPRSYIALQIYRGQRKHLFEIYRQFGHAPSKRFASPAVEYGVQDITSLKGQFDSTFIMHYFPKQLSAFVTVTFGET